MPRIEVGKLWSQELGPTGRRCPGLQRALNAPDRTRVARARARARARAHARAHARTRTRTRTRTRVCAGVRPCGGSPVRLRVIAGPPRGPDPSAPPRARLPRPPDRPDRRPARLAPPAQPARAPRLIQCPEID